MATRIVTTGRALYISKKGGFDRIFCHLQGSAPCPWITAARATRRERRYLKRDFSPGRPMLLLEQLASWMGCLVEITFDISAST